MKSSQSTRPNTLDIDQWRAVFAQVDDALDSESITASEPALEGHSTGRPSASTITSSSAATHSEDDAVDAIVRRWRASTTLNSRTAERASLDEFPGALSLAQPKRDLVLGRYRLLERIGQGGMGSVWRAERTDGLYDAQVAIKLLGSLALSAHARARFAQEGQILARLKHPNIAGLLDAGITADGQRYLVLELIEGVALKDYVEQQSMNANQRLQLFRQLLDAVAFAHERLVIHRDIKPANILVTASGTLKLLDFGVAKLLVEDPDEASLTQVHGSAYTEAYAAPEQIRGDPPTVVADVFSLGMIVLELLTGKRATWASAKRKANPGDHPEELSQISPGDLRAILRKSLEVAPEDRYRSVAALDDDVRRFLRSEPVAAYAAGTRYNAAKFIRRNRFAVGATGAVMLSLIVGAAAATWQWREAKSQAARAEAVQEFMAQMFEETDPENARGKKMTAQDLLDRAAARLATEFKDQPEVRASLQARMGNNYNALGEHVKARVQLESAVSLFEASGRVGDPLYLDALYSLIEARKEEREFDAVLLIAEKLRRAARNAFGEPNRWLGQTLGELSWIATISGDAVKGEAIAREAIRQQLSYAKRTDALGLSIASNLTEALINQSKYAEARDFVASKLAAGAVEKGYSLTDRMVDRYTLARMDYVLNRYPQAVIALQPLVDEMGRHMGIKHPRTMNARNLLAQAMVGADFYDEGVSVQRSNLRIAYAKENANETEDHESAAMEELVLAKLLVMSQPAVAESYAAKGLAFFEKKYERPTWTRERARWILSDALFHRRAEGDAEAQLDTTITNMQLLPAYAGHASYADALQTRALIRAAQSRLDEAASDIAAACLIFETRLPPGAAQTTYCKFYALWIDARRSGRAAPTAEVANVKTRMLELIPATHRSYDTMLAMLTLPEQGVEFVITGDYGAVIWPLSLVDMPIRTWRDLRCYDFKRRIPGREVQIPRSTSSAPTCK